MLIAGSSGIALAQSPADQSDKKIGQELAIRDSLMFDVFFNTCKVEKLPEFLTKDFVFVHDWGIDGRSDFTNYATFTGRIVKSCNNRTKIKMRREVVKSSLQAFSINPSTALQTGVQKFFLSQNGEKERLVEVSKFTRHWRKEQGTWKLADETDFLIDTHPEAALVTRFLPRPYVPASTELYNTVVKLDSLYFDTYNNCKIAEMDSLTAEDIEFYHDRGGLSTSKAQLLESIRKNICGKVTRILTPNSIEVYEVPGYGAIEFGYHSFRNISEPGVSNPSKFVTIWRHKDNRWQMTRVISLH